MDHYNVSVMSRSNQPTMLEGTARAPRPHQHEPRWFADLNNSFPLGFADGEIYSMRTDGSGVRNLTDNNPTDPTALTKGDIHPDWGPSPTRSRHH